MDKNEMQKLTKDMKVQLVDEDTEHVAGGYSREHWEQMSTEERIAAYNESKALRKTDGNAYCAFYDPNA